MKDQDFTTYCGLYCKLCANIARIPKQAAALRETLQKEGYESFGEFVHPGFKQFWEILGKMGDVDIAKCRCRAGCGDPECKIRKCAKGKNIEQCAFCPEYPCVLFSELIKTYPFLAGSNNRLKEIGMEAWLVEQQQFCARGFCYTDNK